VTVTTGRCPETISGMVVGPASALKRVSFQCRMRGVSEWYGGPKKFLQVVAALPGWREHLPIAVAASSVPEPC